MRCKQTASTSQEISSVYISGWQKKGSKTTFPIPSFFTSFQSFTASISVEGLQVTMIGGEGGDNVPSAQFLILYTLSSRVVPFFTYKFSITVTFQVSSQAILHLSCSEPSILIFLHHMLYLNDRLQLRYVKLVCSVLLWLTLKLLDFLCYTCLEYKEDHDIVN